MSTPHAELRTPSSFLMCRPTYYTIAYEINPWMHLTQPVNRRRAWLQWQWLYALLTRTLHARVQLLPARRSVPDLVFTANAGLVEGRTFIRSNFRYPQRQAEESIVEAYFRRRGYRIVRLPSRFRFEGEGDALWIHPHTNDVGARMHDTLLFGFRFRSDAPTHEALARVLHRRVLPVELVDPRFYHLDTCFCPLDARSALWFPKAFDRYGRRVIDSLVADPIAVSDAEAMRFMCNAVVIGRHVVLPAGASRGLQRKLTRRGWNVSTVDLSEFLKAGGSAKCLVLRLAG